MFNLSSGVVPYTQIIVFSFKLKTWDSLKYYYNKMKNTFINSKSKTRNKAILSPKIEKRVSEKNNYITAIKTFNQLPNELRILEIERKSNTFVIVI